LVQAARSIDVLSGAIELRTDRTFTDVLRYRLRGSVPASIVTDTTRGTFLYFVGDLALEPDDGSDMYFLHVTDGHTLRSVDAGVLIECRRP
jgi:hypothetical protein